METLNAETRTELRRLIDLRRREQATPSGITAPRRYTRCGSEAERIERKRRNWRESKRRAKLREAA